MSSFNSDFYITTATIIPVLFLALAVQADAIGKILTRIKETVDKEGNDKESHLRIAFARYAGAAVVFTIAMLSLLSGIVSEIESVLALYKRVNYSQTLVLYSTFGLVIMVAVIPAWTIGRAYQRYLFSLFHAIPRSRSRS